MFGLMYGIRATNRFKKQVKLCYKRGYDLALLEKAVSTLASTGTLPDACRIHKLSGEYDGSWECHIKGDWLLIWEQNDTEIVSALYGYRNPFRPVPMIISNVIDRIVQI